MTLISQQKIQDRPCESGRGRGSYVFVIFSSLFCLLLWTSTFFINPFQKLVTPQKLLDFTTNAYSRPNPLQNSHTGYVMNDQYM